jgi:hypothetical protein
VCRSSTKRLNSKTNISSCSWRLTRFACLSVSRGLRSALSRYGFSLAGGCLLTAILCQVGTERPLHICSYDCDSHFQPHFISVLEAAQLALRDLFSPPEAILRYIREPLSYPTQDHIRLSRVIGLTQHNLYFSDTLLPEETRIEVRSIDPKPWLGLTST